MSGFSIEGTGSSIFIMHNGKPVAGPYTNRCNAYTRLDTLERQARQSERKCLRCGGPFMSDGPHNRMCDPCRIQPYYDGAA